MATFLVSVILIVLLIACLVEKKTRKINVNVSVDTQEFTVNYLIAAITVKKIVMEYVNVSLLILENFANSLPVVVMDRLRMDNVYVTRVILEMNVV